jgi:hypothetical protein
MNPKIHERILAKATPMAGLPPTDQRTFDFTVLSYHKAIAETLSRRVPMQAMLADLLDTFCTFFANYHANLPEALKHAERMEINIGPLMPSLLAHLHMYISDAYQFFAWDKNVSETFEAGPDGEGHIGAPVSMAMGIAAIVGWAESRGIDLEGSFYEQRDYQGMFRFSV